MYIKGVLAKENIEALLKNVFITTGKFKNQLTNLSILAGAIIFIVLFMVKPSFQPVQLSIYVILAIFVAMSVSTIIQKVLIRKLNMEDFPNESESFILHITENGIHEKKEKGNMLLEWADIERVSSDEKNFFLYFNKGPIIIIPKDTTIPKAKVTEMLSTYVDPEKMESAPKAEKKRLKKRVISLGLLLVFVLLCVIQFLFIGSQDIIKTAKDEVNALFVEEDAAENWNVNEEEAYTIKDSVDWQQVKRAEKAVNAIDTVDITDENYLLIFALQMLVLEAEGQLEEREGE